MPETHLKPLNRWLKQVGPAAFAEALAELDPTAAVFAVNADRDVVLWSDGAEQMIGISAADALGRNCRASQRCVRCLQGCGIARLGKVIDQPIEVGCTLDDDLGGFREDIARHAEPVDRELPKQEEPHKKSDKHPRAGKPSQEGT